MGDKCSKSKEEPVEVMESEGKVSMATSFKCADISYMQQVHIEEMLGRNPDDPHLNALMGQCLYNKGDKRAAETYFEQAAQLNYVFTEDTLLALADIKHSQHHYEEAARRYQELLALGSPRADVHHKLFEVALALGNTSDSFTHLKAAVRLDPSNAEYLNDYGLLLFNHNKLSDSEKYFVKALQLKPRFPRAHNNLGNTYRKQGRSPEAVTQYTLAIEQTHKRKFPIALLNLATTYFDQGKVTKALDCFQQALAVGTNIHKLMVAKGYHLLLKSSSTKQGILHFANAEYAKAVTVLGAAVDSDSRNPALYFYLGCSYVHTAASAEARACFLQTLQHGSKPIHMNKPFVQFFVKKAREALSSLNAPEHDEERSHRSEAERPSLLEDSLLPSDYSFNA